MTSKVRLILVEFSTEVSVLVRQGASKCLPYRLTKQELKSSEDV